MPAEIYAHATPLHFRLITRDFGIRISTPTSVLTAVYAIKFVLLKTAEKQRMIISRSRSLTPQFIKSDKV